MFAKIHIIIPAGIATVTALLRTNKVLSIIDVYISLPTCGGLYGGSSRVKVDGTPFNKVLDNINETSKVVITPTIISRVIEKAVIVLERKELLITEAKNMLEMAIKVGNLPLQGTKLLVSMAINLSLGESIILHPITPAALHPNPIHIVKHCLPWQQALLNK